MSRLQRRYIPDATTPRTEKRGDLVCEGQANCSLPQELGKISNQDNMFSRESCLRNSRLLHVGSDRHGMFETLINSASMIKNPVN